MKDIQQISFSKLFIRFNIIIFVTILLVVLAGGIVRMTQSGMGCPDWPKCFGKWIPPTNEYELPSNYKEIYAFKYVDTSFNVYHTWIEYINRLLGALLGVFVFINFIWSGFYFEKNSKVFWLSLLLFFLTGFQGWLGKLVVDTNLSGVKITIHMVVAMVIAAISLYILTIILNVSKVFVSNKYKNLSLLVIILILLQIVLGTTVREQVDVISLKYNFLQRNLWIQELDFGFKIHRTFSLFILGIIAYLYYLVKHLQAFNKCYKLVFSIILSEILLGVVMTYFSIPAIAQPLHLLFSTALVLSITYNYILASKY